MLTYGTQPLVNPDELTDGQVQLTASELPAGRPGNSWLTTALAYLLLATALMAAAVAAVKLGFLP
jgi:hypothetical protein